MSRRGSGSRIYIGNLPENIAEDEIEEIFKKYGRIRGIDIKSARSISGTTYAFLEYEDSIQAENAVDRKNGSRFDGNRLRVEFTGDRRPKRNFNKSHGPPKRSSYRVYVTGLPPVASWQDLKDHMRKAGPVGYANIERKVGIVEYETREDMERAIRKLDRSEFKNIFHRCEIRVKADNEGGYRNEYSRGMRPRHSRSPSRSRSRRSYRSHQQTSHSSHSRHSRRRYSDERSQSIHRSSSKYRSEGRDSRHRSHNERRYRSRTRSMSNQRSYTPDPHNEHYKFDDRSRGKSYTPSRKSYSRSHSSPSIERLRSTNETYQPPHITHENGAEEPKKNHSASRSRSPSHSHSRSRTPTHSPENRPQSRGLEED